MKVGKKILVVGDWHLAFVTASVLAEVGHSAVLVQPSSANSTPWKSFPPIPVMEPGLEDMIARNRAAGRLEFHTGLEGVSGDYAWLAVDTPVNEKDEPDVEPLLELADQIARLTPRPQALIVSSQIPLTFCRTLEKRTGLKIAYIPENLRLGKGIETFQRADRTVIGSDDMTIANDVKALLTGFQTEFFLCDSVTAEMVKHATNAFLATSISFANELARVGEKFGVDSVLVGKALKLDTRIGKAAYVVPGLGFAGGTLPRDLRVLQQLGRQHSVPTPLVNSVVDVNENTTQAIAETVMSAIEDAKLPKTVLILGYTYKADTNTLRRSLSLDLADTFKKAGYTVLGFDPMMNDQNLEGLRGRIEHLPELAKLQQTPSVSLLMTARPIFKEINWNDLAAKSLDPQKRPMVMDCQNFLNSEPILRAGFMFKSLWSPSKRPEGAAHASR